MLFIVLLFIGIANPSRRLLNDFDSEEIVKTNRRRTKVRLSDFDFVDADDVGLDKVQWDKPHRKPKMSWLKKQHHHRQEEWRVADGPMKVAKHQSYRQKEKQRRSRAQSRGDAKQVKEDGKKQDDKVEQKKQSEDQSENESNKDKGKKEDQKEDPEAGDNILKKVKEKSQQEHEKKEPAKGPSKEEGGDSLSDQKKKVQAKLDKIVKEKKKKEKKCDAICDKNTKNPIDCLQCELSTDLLRLNQEQTQCSLKCLVDEDVKACKEGCFKVKAKSLYVVMEDYLKKKKELMETKCQDLCSKTGQTGDIYNCWKCRMAEQMTRVARCRHKCQHKVKKNQKGDCFPACLEAVEANMKKLMDEDKERQNSGKEASDSKGKDDAENKEKDASEKKESDSKKETAQKESNEKGKDADKSKGKKNRGGNDGW